MNRTTIVDRAWRTGKPPRDINREDFDAGQRAAHCAKLLGIPPTAVWPEGAPDIPGDDEHSAFLFEYMTARVAEMERQRPAPALARRLALARAVLEGRVKPGDMEVCDA